MKKVIVIPADTRRQGAGKPLIEINRRPIIQWVYEKHCVSAERQDYHSF
jgi:CMP-2-keto-3-deoxyoctulosonic acid synthetase